jgi:hypothetical protein
LELCSHRVSLPQHIAYHALATKSRSSPTKNSYAGN